MHRGVCDLRPTGKLDSVRVGRVRACVWVGGGREKLRVRARRDASLHEGPESRASFRESNDMNSNSRIGFHKKLGIRPRNGVREFKINAISNMIPDAVRMRSMAMRLQSDFFEIVIAISKQFHFDFKMSTQSDFTDPRHPRSSLSRKAVYR